MQTKIASFGGANLTYQISALRERLSACLHFTGWTASKKGEKHGIRFTFGVSKSALKGMFTFFGALALKIDSA